MTYKNKELRKSQKNSYGHSLDDLIREVTDEIDEKMMMEVHFSSKSNEWSTPLNVFNKLDDEFCFDLDPCSDGSNAKCEKYFTIEEDGLVQDWSENTVFMNPPYGREIKRWVKKAYEESLKGAVVVCLIPARTDTSYWHEYIF